MGILIPMLGALMPVAIFILLPVLLAVNRQSSRQTRAPRRADPWAPAPEASPRAPAAPRPTPWQETLAEGAPGSEGTGSPLDEGRATEGYGAEFSSPARQPVSPPSGPTPMKGGKAPGFSGEGPRPVTRPPVETAPAPRARRRAYTAEAVRQGFIMAQILGRPGGRRAGL